MELTGFDGGFNCQRRGFPRKTSGSSTHAEVTWVATPFYLAVSDNGFSWRPEVSEIRTRCASSIPAYIACRHITLEVKNKVDYAVQVYST